MKKQYLLSVKEPCAENWENFTPTSDGGFCSSCRKNVVDFTKMSDKEVMQFLGEVTGNTCGRLRSNQLNYAFSPSTNSNKLLGWQWMKAGIASLSMILVSQNGFAKNIDIQPKVEVVQVQNQSQKRAVDTTPSHTISGVVIDEFGDPIPGANVVLKGSRSATITDLDGRFVFPVEVNTGDILVFSFIGFESVEYVIRKEDSASIVLRMTLDQYVLMGELAVEEVYESKTSGIRGLWSKIKGLF